MFAKFNQPPLHHQYLVLHPEEQEQEEESRNSGVTVKSASKKPKADPDSATEEGTIEVAKRRRGRPPGSKNKPKPPTVITREEEEAECAMRPIFLELPTGLDIIDAIARFTHRRNLGLTVLSASGSVTNVSFRQPASGDGGIVKFHGRFEILSISATFLPPSLPIRWSPPSPLPSSFTISLVGPQGQIIGGSIAGSLITSSTVYIVAASFDNPTYHRLPVKQAANNNSTLQQEHHHESSSPNPPLDSSPCGMSHSQSQAQCVYQVPPAHQDLIWSSTPRSSPPF